MPARPPIQSLASQTAHGVRQRRFRHGQFLVINGGPGALRNFPGIVIWNGHQLANPGRIRTQPLPEQQRPDICLADAFT